MTALGVDSVFRKLYRSRLLVVMYHGVTRHSYTPPFWTQLPESTFKDQLTFLKKNYRLISLSTLIEALASGRKLPDNPAMVTFDDGFKNNYRVAFPLLKELSIPGVVFLSTELIDTQRFFWFDELYFIVKQALSEGRDPREIAGWSRRQATDFGGVYADCLTEMKRLSEEKKDVVMNRLKEAVEIDLSEYGDDIGTLTWRDVSEMHASGLVEFGVHTGNHRILSRLSVDQLDQEIAASKRLLEEKLGGEITSFCYPNGRPGIDFTIQHQEYLKQCGFRVSFTTENKLNRITRDLFEIGRIPAGNDMTSEPDTFRLAAAGVTQSVKHLMTLVRNPLS